MENEINIETPIEIVELPPVYLRNPNTKQIHKFTNINAIDLGFEKWEYVENDIAEKELEENAFEEAKNIKLQELETYYNSNEAWLLTLRDNLGNALTRPQEWFLIRITPQINLIDNKGNLVSKTLGNPESLKTTLNNKGLEIAGVRSALQEKIKKAKTLEALNKVDIIKAFDVVNRVIEIKE